MNNRQHDWMFDSPINLGYKGQKFYKPDPEAAKRREKLAEIEHQRELKRLEREVWDI